MDLIVDELDEYIYLMEGGRERVRGREGERDGW